jgi:hypothetical protein
MGIVTALYSIIHVPCEEQPALVRRIWEWLTPGGQFLATWSVDRWEGFEQDWQGWGCPRWWSHFDAEANLTMLREARFAIETAEQPISGRERWLWVRARKVV